MTTNILLTKDNSTYTADPDDDSESLLMHVNNGDRIITSQEGLDRVTSLADAHNWRIQIRDANYM